MPQIQTVAGNQDDSKFATVKEAAIRTLLQII
jgi:hypothetical protein